jgi:hypothetical protein
MNTWWDVCESKEQRQNIILKDYSSKSCIKCSVSQMTDVVKENFWVGRYVSRSSSKYTSELCGRESTTKDQCGPTTGKGSALSSTGLQLPHYSHGKNKSECSFKQTCSIGKLHESRVRGLNSPLPTQQPSGICGELGPMPSGKIDICLTVIEHTTLRQWVQCIVHSTEPSRTLYTKRRY